MGTEPTVFVVDDDPGVREGVRILLRSVQRNVELFPSAQAFLDSWDPARSGCVVLDVRMPGSSGLDLQAQLRSQGHDIPIVIITGHGDVPAAVQALKAGAIDFIEKPFSDQVLLDRIDQAIRVDARNRHARGARTAREKRLARLSPREREALDLLVAGKSCKQIAAEFGISHQAAAAHRSRIIEKMEVDNVVDLVKLVLEPTVRRDKVNPYVEDIN